jgi:xylulokinase
MERKTYLLAHDLGTSGNKAVLFCTDGTLSSSCVSEYPLISGEDGMEEQDADDWWRAVCLTTKKLIEQSHIRPDQIAAVSFSGQMMGCLPVDKTGHPLRKAIIWADTRARKETHELSEKLQDNTLPYRITGHRNIPSYGIQKAMWIHRNEPEIYQMTYKFLNAKDYIVFRLTGRFCTDPSDADSTDAMDIYSLQWSDELLQAADIEKDKMPEIVPSTTIAGTVTKTASEECGLLTGTPVVMGAGDGVAANVGADAVRPGLAYLNMGTSAWVAGTSAKPVIDPEGRTMCWPHAVPGLYSPNGTMQYAGGSYTWMKKELCCAEQMKAEAEKRSIYQLINDEILSSEAGAGGVIFLPYLLGERAPRWNPDARGVFFGLNGSTTRKDIFRSVAEGVVMNLHVCYRAFSEYVTTDRLLLTGGGARSSMWRRIIADIFQMPVDIPEHQEEVSSIGAAVIAGVGVGIFPNFEVADRFVKVIDTVIPDPSVREIYQAREEKFDDVYNALKSVF